MVLFNLQSACDRFIQSRAPSSRALLRFRSGRSLERLTIIPHAFRNVNTFFQTFFVFFKTFLFVFFRHFSTLLDTFFCRLLFPSVLPAVNPGAQLSPPLYDPERAPLYITAFISCAPKLFLRLYYIYVYRVPVYRTTNYVQLNTERSKQTRVSSLSSYLYHSCKYSAHPLSAILKLTTSTNDITSDS